MPNVLRFSLFMLTEIAVYLYLFWRLLFTLPEGYVVIFGLILLGSEVIQTIQATIFHYILYKPALKEPSTLPSKLFEVDLFVTTYNESIDVLRRTVTACTNLDYPDDLLKIYICDDGNREEVHKLALELGVNYITRTDNKHAKAGNLNNALAQTYGELIVTLDADMIPKPSFLKRSIGFFDDPNFAFVQIPQSFYNQDIFQHNMLQGSNIPNEQDMFMRAIQSGRDRFNAAIYIGSNTVIRRTAIDSIGGFATGTITEDLATGMLLQAKGYKTAYLNEVLVQGLATESFQDFLNQRIRWARGTIQTFKKWNPVFLKGLSPMQRILYMSSVFYWYHGFFKIIFIISPLLYLLLGITVLKATLSGLIVFWLPQYFLSIILLRTCTSDMRTALWSHVYETITAPLLFWETFKETTGLNSIGFNVTPKNIVINRVYFHWRLVLPHLLLILLSIMGIYRGLEMLTGGSQISSVIINLFWTVYNVIALMGSLIVAIEQPRVRKTERFVRSYPAVIETNNGLSSGYLISGETVDISEKGCKILVKKAEMLKENIYIMIFASRKFQFESKVIYFDKFKDGYQIAVEFENITPTDFKDWLNEVYGQQNDESAFYIQKESRNPLRIFSQYISKFHIHHSKALRKSPRLYIEAKCEIQLVHSVQESIEEVAAASENSFTTENMTLNRCKLVNISFGGCQIEANFLTSYLKSGDKILVKIDGFKQTAIGEVVSLINKNNTSLIGLKWQEESMGNNVMKEAQTILSKGKINSF